MPAAPFRRVVRPLAAWARTVFTLDLRSLALFRVVLALTLISDLGNRLVDLTAHYSDAGVFPRSLIRETSFPSVHMLGGSAEFQGTLIATQILIAVGLLVGYRTPLMAFASWALLVSLHNRNTTLLHGGDVLERIILLWSIFLPMGARYSVDGLRDRGEAAAGDQRVFSAGTAALLLQVGCVYFFSVFLKSGDAWRKDGTAVFYALSLEQFRTPLGDVVYQYPELMRFLTFASLALELFGPLMLLTPVWNGPVRTLVVVSYLGFHAGLGLCLELGNFPWVCAAMWVALLPTWFWEKFSRRPAATPPDPPPARPDRVGWVETAMVSALIVYVVLCNFRSVNPDLGNKLLPPKVDRIGGSFQIMQAWNMFAPQPSRLDAWIAVGGKLKNGRELDLWLDERPLSNVKPVPVAPTYRNSRWRRYLMNLYEEPWKEFRVPFANYMWREWDARHTGDEQLALLEAVAFMEIVSAENPQPQWDKQKRRLALLDKPPE